MHYDLTQYSLEKCLRCDCSGCDREKYASCGDLINELEEREALDNESHSD